MPLDFKKYDQKKYDQSSWLNAESVKEGERLIVTVAKVYEHTFEDGKESPVLEFPELNKKLSLNQTRISKMRELLGDDSDKWIGHQVVLYRVDVNFNGKLVGSIAIGPAPKQKPNQAADDSDVVFGKH